MSWKIVVLITSAIFIIISVALSTLIWAVHSSASDAATAPPIVATPAGRFLGVITSSKIYGGSYVAYKSIPFAKPPIGNLRFKRPQPLGNVDPSALSNSDQYQKSCWSVTRKSTDVNYAEDCLYLNVYVPETVATIGGGEKLPVIIWIHGGGYVAGNTFPEPDKLVMDGQVIVVSINYRLGVFGFLTTGDDELPSNNGLWDQALAIQWVKDYISYFEGDQESITVFGESSGATSVALHLLSPVSSPFFKKAILQSGGATSLISRHYQQRAEEFSVMVGCSINTSTLEMAQCLRTVSIEDILKFSKPSAFNISVAQQQLDFIWMPIVDGNFIQDEPLKLIRNITYLTSVNAFDKDVLIGVLNNEGSLIVDHFIKDIPQSQLANITFVNDLTDYLLLGRYGLGYNVSQEVKNKIYSFYIGSQLDKSVPNPVNVMELAGDFNFIVPAVELAVALSRCHQSNTPSCVSNSSEPPATCPKTASKTFLYHFDYCPQTEPCLLPCMTHGLDVAYYFPKTNFSNPVDQQVSDVIVGVLAAFAKNSNPSTALSCEWPTFDISSQSYLRIDINPTVRRYLYDYRVKFWLSQTP